MKLMWTKEKQSWRVENWMKVIFTDKSRICIGQGDDAETSVWCCLNVTKMTEENTFSKSFMIWDCMSFQGQEEMAILSQESIHIKILDNLISSLKLV